MIGFFKEMLIATPKLEGHGKRRHISTQMSDDHHFPEEKSDSRRETPTHEPDSSLGSYVHYPRTSKRFFGHNDGWQKGLGVATIAKMLRFLEVHLPPRLAGGDRNRLDSALMSDAFN